MKKIILILTAISLTILSCNNNADTKSESAEDVVTKEDSLYKEVIEGHDEGMMKMRRLLASQKAVQQALDSLNLSTKVKLNTVYIQQLEGLKEELAQAEADMNLWMESFSPDTMNSNKEKRVLYLEAEKAKVAKVNELINKSIGKTDSLLKK